jgi:hypothetical protein
MDSKKGYSAKSSVVRSAKKVYGDKWEDYGAPKQNNEDGKWYWVPFKNDVKKHEHKPVGASKAIGDRVKAKAKAKPAKVVKAEEPIVDKGDKADSKVDWDKWDIAKESINVTLDGKLRTSNVKNPCKVVWEIAEQAAAKLPEGEKPRRKEVIEQCIKAGVATHTARTQYQQWYTAMYNSK